MRTVRAKFNGLCTGCGRSWKIGSTITKAPTGRWVHIVCYKTAVELAIARAPIAAADEHALPPQEQKRRDRHLADTDLHKRITELAGGAPAYL